MPGIPKTMTNENFFPKKSRTSASETRTEFEDLFLPHLDAACNLARLLTRNAHDAEDVVQESYLKALRAFSSFRGGDSRSGFLTIVRNTSFTWRRDNRTTTPNIATTFTRAAGLRLRPSHSGMNARGP